MKVSVSIFILSVLIFIACDYKPRNQGKALYQRHCQNCHMESGQGLGALIPPIADADFVLQNKARLACIIRDGIEGPIEVNGVEYDVKMEGASRLSEVEVSNLVHYILVDLNNQSSSYSFEEVKAQLDQCSSP